MTEIRSDNSRAENAEAPDPKAMEAIGRALKAHYSNLVQAPLPESLSRVLARFPEGDQVSEPKRSRNAIG